MAWWEAMLSYQAPIISGPAQHLDTSLKQSFLENRPFALVGQSGMLRIKDGATISAPK